MITYQKDQQQVIPDSEVIIVGIGGAGSNIIDRVALDGMENAKLVVFNTDTRGLQSTVAKTKIQMGAKLTHGLGCGGDPELGLQAAQEVEDEIRDVLHGHKMVFVCVGLGGGTGSGAAPLVTRVARELGAFVVVFGTMPFIFEGRRRMDQAETSLNELSVLANALVTFDNGRMGELVVASKGIHDAFTAADNMISESIRAVTRLVIKPGLINVGLDDLMSALRATRSRCLFGSGIASGENRSQKALKNALSSPLLDKGSLLKNTQTALVHVCGGGEMTLYEVELLMRELSKVVPKDAHILFGAAVDDSMGDSLSITIISSLPEEFVRTKREDEDYDFSAKEEKNAQVKESVAVEANVLEKTTKVEVNSAPEKVEPKAEVESSHELPKEELEEEIDLDDAQASEQVEKLEVESATEDEPSDDIASPEEDDVQEEPVQENEPKDEDELASPKDTKEKELNVGDPQDKNKTELSEKTEEDIDEELSNKKRTRRSKKSKSSKEQGELLLDGGPRGKFEGEAPNIVDGEDLDIPPFLRNRR